MHPSESGACVHHRCQLLNFLRRGGIPHSYFGAETAHYDACFSTCLNSSSTGVDRPKIVTITLTVSLSSLTSSMIPSNVANGPSVIFTFSFFSNFTLSFGLSFDSPALYTMC